MSELSTKERNKLPDSAFALPGRRFPIHDKSHARNALARASEALNKGWISKTEHDTIVKKANKVLDKDEAGTESFSPTISLWTKTFKKKN